MIKWDGRGHAAEEVAAKQFNGELVEELELQYKDIDLIIPSVKDDCTYTVSVKDQTYSTGKGFKTVQIELELRDTLTGDTMQGCFYSNESDYYFWRVIFEGDDIWVIVKSKVLKTYIHNNRDSLTQWHTTENTNRKNKALGRKFNSSRGVTMTIEDLISLGAVREVELCTRN